MRSAHLEHASLGHIRMWKCVPRLLFGLPAKVNLESTMEGFIITGHAIRPLAGIFVPLQNLMGLALKKGPKEHGAGNKTLYSLTHHPLGCNYIRSVSTVLFPTPNLLKTKKIVSISCCLSSLTMPIKYQVSHRNHFLNQISDIYKIRNIYINK